MSSINRALLANIVDALDFVAGVEPNFLGGFVGFMIATGDAGLLKSSERQII